MKTKQTIPFKAFKKVIAFLEKNNWTLERSTDKASFYSPPETLGFDPKFAIALPASKAVSISSNLLVSVLETLSDIYEIKPSDILDFSIDYDESIEHNEEETWLLRSRLIDNSIGRGDIPLTKLDKYLSGITRSLYEIAKQETDETAKKTVSFAPKFLDHCTFLPTEAGSFIAAISIPNVTIKPKGLFDEKVDSRRIINSWFDAIRFINNQVLQGDQSVSDNLVQEAIDTLNLPSAEAISEMISESRISEFEFSLATPLGTSRTSSGKINKASIERLDDFIKLYKETILSEDNVSFTGSIIELRSRNPSGNLNHISIKSKFHGDVTRISMTLNNTDYLKAIDAHQRNRPVSVTGKAIRLKTQLRVTKIDSFEIS